VTAQGIESLSVMSARLSVKEPDVDEETELPLEVELHVELDEEVQLTCQLELEAL
jgi:hypothetical protein